MILPTDPGVILIGLVLEDPKDCELCNGTGWATFPDPFLDGELIDAACPCGAPDHPRRPLSIAR